MPRLRLRHILLLVGLLPLAARADPEDDPELPRLLAAVRRDEDPDAWTEAVRSLRARGADEALGRVLRDLLEERRRARDDAAKAIEALAAAAGDGTREEKPRRAWEEAREAARDWLLDRTRFPDVPDPIRGPEVGSEEARRRLETAVEARRRLARSVDRALAPLRRLSPAEATRRREALATAEERLGRVADALGTRVESTSPPPLALALQATAEERFDEAARRYRSMEGWEKLCAFEAYGRGVLAWNRRNPAGQGRRAIEAIESLNALRLGIGLEQVHVVGVAGPDGTDAPPAVGGGSGDSVEESVQRRGVVGGGERVQVVLVGPLGA